MVEPGRTVTGPNSTSDMARGETITMTWEEFQTLIDQVVQRILQRLSLANPTPEEVSNVSTNMSLIPSRVSLDLAGPPPIGFTKSWRLWSHLNNTQIARRQERFLPWIDKEPLHAEEKASQDTPFSSHVLDDELPRNFRTPQLKEYTSSSNPEDHLGWFENTSLHQYT